MKSVIIVTTSHCEKYCLCRCGSLKKVLSLQKMLSSQPQVIGKSVVVATMSHVKSVFVVVVGCYEKCCLSGHKSL